MRESSRRIGYLAHVLPSLPETFVVREIAALRSLKVEIKVFSLHRPEVGVVHREAPDLAKEVEVLLRPAHPLFWLAHLFFAMRFPPRYMRCLREWGFPIREPWPRRVRCLAHFFLAPFLAFRLQRAGIDHLHAHFANTSASIGMMAARLAGIPFSFTAHAYDIFVDDILLPAKLSSASFVVTCTNFNAAYLRQQYLEATNAKIVVVHHGIDPGLFAPGPHPEGWGLILSVGRLVEKKGFHLLVEACSELQAEGEAACCVIIGNGPEAPRLQRMIADLQLADRVLLLGARPFEEVIDYYRKAAVFVMPSCVRGSDRDGIPNVLIEAMAMEVPVVATSVSGIPELVRDDQTGLVVEPDEPAGLAKAILRVLRDRSLAYRLAKNGRKVVLKEFNIHENTKKIAQLFHEAMDRNGMVPRKRGKGLSVLFRNPRQQGDRD